ncbi:TadE/TadG family type IV pilus assembly protein [Gluconacetobacter takamatsuzukensis]|uniref:TadE-like domain-containing protein n=1 Tax=Gluconacetobacter takamatsuzukensis TaxID=1286190 RepID=A0A7W4PSC3_9PROT|nr:TadE/TadG family type IV pilus assembly protein [Gluconacetobacter takamatsuzukensis]MBB2204791.1 hypothetical protein [Gluconacetobacter takamatsuzukensis]
MALPRRIRCREGDSSFVRTKIPAFLACRRGVAALEFGLVVVPFIVLLVATLVTSLSFFIQSSLLTCAETASRWIITGQQQKLDAAYKTQTAAALQQNFQTEVCAVLPAFMQCSNLIVQVESAASFDDIDTTLPTVSVGQNGTLTSNASYTPGGTGVVVLVRLLYSWNLPSSILGYNFATTATNGQQFVVATLVAKSEPF